MKKPKLKVIKTPEKIYAPEGKKITPRIWHSCHNGDILVIHGQDLMEWCKKWGLRIVEAPCKCGRTLFTTLPFVCGPRRGVIAPQCECGHYGMPFCMIRIDGDFLSKGW